MSGLAPNQASEKVQCYEGFTKSIKNPHTAAAFRAFHDINLEYPLKKLSPTVIPRLLVTDRK
jgi:hypothetical protein